jgi:hypothetical protein
MNSPYSKQSTKPPPPDGTVMCSAGKILNIPKPGSVSGAGFGVRAAIYEYTAARESQNSPRIGLAFS